MPLAASVLLFKSERARLKRRKWKQAGRYTPDVRYNKGFSTPKNVAQFLRLRRFTPRYDFLL